VYWIWIRSVTISFFYFVQASPANFIMSARDNDVIPICSLWGEKKTATVRVWYNKIGRPLDAFPAGNVFNLGILFRRGIAMPSLRMKPNHSCFVSFGRIKKPDRTRSRKNKTIFTIKTRWRRDIKNRTRYPRRYPRRFRYARGDHKTHTVKREHCHRSFSRRSQCHSPNTLQYNY